MTTKLITFLTATIISTSLIAPHKIPKPQKISTFENGQIPLNLIKFPKRDKELKKVNLSGDLDLDYIDQMLSHNLEIIDLSKEALNNTKNDSIKEVSNNIISSLDSQLSLMKGLLTEFKKSPKVNEKLEMSYISDYMTIMSKMDKTINKLKKTSKTDIDFLKQIIPREEALLSTSKCILKYTKNHAIISLSEDLIKTQTQNINDLKEIEKTLNK